MSQTKNSPERCIAKFMKALKNIQDNHELYGNADFKRGVDFIGLIADEWFHDKLIELEDEKCTG